MMHSILCTRYLGCDENAFLNALKILIVHFRPIYKILYSDGYLLPFVLCKCFISHAEDFIYFLSVKIWLANIEGLNQCTNAEEVPFALVAEVHNKHRPTIHISHERFMRYTFFSFCECTTLI